MLLHLVAMTVAVIGTTARNPIDRRFRSAITQLFARFFADEDSRQRMSQTLLQVILSLSDQQLITGLAILIVATIRMQVGQLSVYHYSICTDLAWFSSNTHLATLDILTEHLRRRQKSIERKDTLGRPLTTSEKLIIKRPSWPVLIRVSHVCPGCVFEHGYRHSRG
jgi:hypothetical protein